MINDFPTGIKPAWPLLQLFSSCMHLNAIVKEKQQLRPKLSQIQHFLLRNSQVKILTEGFVGRRQQLKTSLRALKQDYDKLGVVILGTAGLGKSCLAGKICERFTDHNLIIVNGNFNATTLEAAMVEAFILTQDEKGRHILNIKKGIQERLVDLCATSFKEINYLFLLDDFDINIAGADEGQPGSLLPESADLLKIILHYLPYTGKMTQLIITSRYDFSLTVQTEDVIAERLEKVWLTSFQVVEQRKKIRYLKNIPSYED